MLVIEQFKASVETSIRRYERLFNEDAPMGLHRAQNIIALRYLLTTTRFDSVDDAIDAVEGELSNFKTGWWIFKTGNSRLRDNIRYTMLPYHNRLLCDSFQSLADLHLSMEDLTLLAQYKHAATQRSTAHNSNQSGFRPTQRTEPIAIPRQTELEEENARLRKTIASLKAQSVNVHIGVLPRIHQDGSKRAFLMNTTSSMPINADAEFTESVTPV